MNTIERRKLEGVITSKLNEIREALKERRQREHTALVEQYEKTPPTNVKDLVLKYTAILKAFDAKEADLEKQRKALTKKQEQLSEDRREALNDIKSRAKQLGYEIETSYRDDNRPSVSLAYETKWEGRYGNTPIRTYHAPALTAHDKETQTRLQKIDDLAHDYTVKIWAEGEDMGKLLSAFNEEVAKLTS